MIVPLQSGFAYQRLAFTVDGAFIELRLRWILNGGYYMVDVYKDNSLKLSGRGLHIGVDLFEGYLLGLGTLKLEGTEATPENLGVKSRLVYEAV